MCAPICIKRAHTIRARFFPAPCNRIDRFTGGIVIFAKTKEALLAVDALIRARKLRKFYHCIVRGTPKPPRACETLPPQGRKARTRARPAPSQGAQAAETRYRTLEARGDVSLVECELITGRTHQIRAQMAHAGHPLLGDGQYGDAAWNRAMGRGQQALYAVRLEFPADLPGRARSRFPALFRGEIPAMRRNSAPGAQIVLALGQRAVLVPRRLLFFHIFFSG